MAGADRPEPLTPPDCDLRGMPYMKLDLVRLFDSDFYAISTGDEFKAGFTLWGRSFLQVPAASLPDDERILAHLSGAGKDWKKVRDVAMRGWIKCSDGRWYHQVVAAKAIEAWEKRAAFRERTKNATEARRQRNVERNVGRGGNVTSTKGEREGERERERKKESTPKPPKGADWVLPDWIPPKVWADFVAHRRAKKAPITDNAFVLLVQHLTEWRQNGHNPAVVLNNSIENGWTGIFEPKQVAPMLPLGKPVNGTPRVYDQRYFSPSTPKQIIALPRPKIIGSPEDVAWNEAGDGFYPDPPAGMVPGGHAS